jgi:hypothetical protein
VAALVNGLDIIRTTDGPAWLLGDEGSGTWLACKPSISRTTAVHPARPGVRRNRRDIPPTP